MGDFIQFLGTAGARVTVSKQARHSGGTWLRLNGANILIDPGPGTLYHAISAGLDPGLLEAIIVSHRHIDHSTEANVMIEAMCKAGKERRGVLFAPAECVDPPEPVIFSYALQYPTRVETLVAENRYELENISFRTSLPHRHPAEVYGLIFERAEGDLGMMIDTAFFPELMESYKGVKTLVANVVLYPNIWNKFVEHLHFDDLIEIVAAIKPETLIMTHFGMGMLQNDPPKLARELEQKTGVRVIAAEDGMKLEL